SEVPIPGGRGRSEDAAERRQARRLRRDRDGQEGRVDRPPRERSGRHEALDDVPHPSVDAGGDRRQLRLGRASTYIARASAAAWVLGIGVVCLTGGAAAKPPRGHTVEYWVAAVPVVWNIVPNGRDAITNTPVAREDSIVPTVVYRRFSPNWRKPLP